MSGAETFAGELRAAISNAYYEARNHGRTMEQAADDATVGVLAVFATLADDDDLVETARQAIEDQLVEWRDDTRFMVCGNGFTIREKDGSPSTIIRFRTDIGLRIGLRALTAALTERAS